MLTTELARKAGITAETVRFYTRKGLLSAVRDENNGCRIYQKDALIRLRFILHAEQSKTPCSRVREMLQEKILETKQKIENYQRSLALMEQTQAEWKNQPDNQPDSKVICCLIENLSDKTFSQIKGDKK